VSISPANVPWPGLNPTRKPLISSHFPQYPPSYATSHIDSFNHALKLSQTSPSSSKSLSAELEPILWVNALSRDAIGGVGMGGAGLCHVEKEGLRFLVPVGHERECCGSLQNAEPG
jgi:AP-3 complex subunit mu